MINGPQRVRVWGEIGHDGHTVDAHVITVFVISAVAMEWNTHRRSHNERRKQLRHRRDSPTLLILFCFNSFHSLS